MVVDGVTELDRPRLTVSTATVAMLAIAVSVLLLAASVVATDLLWRASLLHVRSIVLVAAALLAHLRVRTESSTLVAGLHLAALESCITDLMATGSWASGWAAITVLHPATPAVSGLAILAVSTALGYARFRQEAPTMRRLWPLVVAGSVLGTSLSRALTPTLVWIAVGAIVGALALVWTVDLHRALSNDRRLTSDDIWTSDWRWPLALWSVLASVLLSRLVFQSVPHVPDEVAYWFHARYFAAGYLWLPSPPDARAFELQHVLNADGRWYSIFTPGWPAILALGFKVGVPTLINPLLAGLTILVLYPLLRRLYGVVVANVACALLALSPMFLLMSAGLMAHPLSAFCMVSAAASLHRAWRDRSVAFGLLAGVPLGLLTLSRPFEGMLVCVAFGLYAAIECWRARDSFARERAIAGVSLLMPISAVAVGALLLPYFRALTGNAFDDPIRKYFDTVYYPGSNRLGFGPDIANFGWGTDFMPGHSPLEGALNVQLSAQLIHYELFGWALGSFAPLVLYLLWRKRLWSREDTLFVAVAVTVVIGQAFYWYAGADYGARYWYQVLVPCCVLAAKALSHVELNHRRLAPAALVLSAIGVLIFVPWRAATKYVGYRGMSDSVVRLMHDCPMTNGLVLVTNATEGAPFGIYSAAAILNQPGFQGSAPIFVRDVSPEVTHALQHAFPNRPVWKIDVPQDPRATARVVEQPSSATAACHAAETPVRNAS